MGADQPGKAQGPAVSSGESSMAQPRPAPGASADPPSPGSYDLTMVPGASLPSNSDLTIAGPVSKVDPAMAAIGSVVIEIGTVIGGRYEIQKLLGMGGMGAVYQAFDRELERPVGLKVIRPDLAGNPEILARFKRELILARQVTHRNIIRIFDLSEADGLKFITMEYIDGEDLRSVFVREKKLAPNLAVDIMLQVCRGLGAAHAEGVIHRDLKPSNIMRDGSGRVVVMDFGLARTMHSDGMTQSGLMIGTMEYMSPEQSMGLELDARSDLFALGLIFYEALGGEVPFKAESPIASLVKRTVENARPIKELEPSVPEGLSAIVAKCLEREPAHRYASAEEIVEDLEAWRGKGPLTHVGKMPLDARTILPIPAVAPPAAPAKKKESHWLGLVVAGVALAIAAFGGYFVQSTIGTHKTAGVTAQKAKTVLVADFRNNTSDSVFDSTLEPAYALQLEGASFISVYNRAQAQSALAKMKGPGAVLDEANARLVAMREGIDYVVSGSLTRTAKGYQIFSKVTDARTGNPVSAEQLEVIDKNGMLRAVATLASRARTALGDRSSETEKLAQAETFTSDSLEASHEYAEAQQARYAGKQNEAIKGFRRAIELDPNFGSAYGNLAALYWNAGDQAEAITYYKQAMQHIDRMTDREKYRTRGGYYLAVSDGEKAVEEFSNLVKQYPSDSMGLSALAHAYYLRHDMAKAVEESQKAIEIYPKNVVYRNNAALYAMFAGDFKTAEDEANAILQISPNYEDALTTLALCATEKGDFDKAAQYWAQEQAASADGASAAYGGLGDLALYRSDPAQAELSLKKGIENDLAANNPVLAGKKWVELAEALLMAGKKAEAVQAVNKGLALGKADVTFAAARVYNLAGESIKAASLAADLEKRIDAQPQAFGKIIEGDIQLSRGNAKDALLAYQQSERLMDSWLARLSMAKAYVDAEAFTDASTELENCLKRRGEATDIYIDDQQTFRYFPPTYYYQGRALEGLKSPGAADAYKKFLAVKVANSQDPLVLDAQKRLAKLQAR